MSQQTEEYFPRGGTKLKPTTHKRPKQENLFTAHEEQTKLKAKKVRKEHNKREREGDNEALDEPRLLTADVLSYKKIQEGMLVLGCIRKVKSLSMEIELPGRTHGIVLIKHISTQYYKELNKMLSVTSNTDELPRLNQLFQEGQYIPTKVIGVEVKEKGTKVWLSINPSDINSSLQHTQIKTGMLVWGSVLEKSDHGYIVDLGVGNCRVLLPFKQVDKGVHYNVGQPFYSVVTKCENLKQASTVTISALKVNIDENLESSELSLDHIIPGMQVEYVVDKILKHGLEGKFFDRCLGYINDLYLTCPLEPLKKYHEDQALKARVLYVQPTTKFAYLTLRNLDTVKRPAAKIGQKQKSQVLSRIGNGVVVKIGSTELGFVTYNRILKSMNLQVDDVKKAIAKKYAVGSIHPCVILDYNQIEQMYICTFDGDVSKQCIISKYELKPGQTVSAIVNEIKPQGLLVKVGSLQAFINNIHLSNSEYSEKIKSKFKVGQVLKAKVWHIDANSDSIKLTIKPDFMNCNDHLLSNEDAVMKKEYAAMAVKGTRNGVLVVFFDNIRAWLPRVEIPQLTSEDASNIFYEGQILKCYVLKNVKQKMVVTLKPPSARNPKFLKTGNVVSNAKVVKISPLGLDLVVAGGTRAFLPTEHLACGELGHVVLGTYVLGDTIDDLVCIGVDGRPILSLKEYQHRKMPLLKDIEINSLVRCYYSRHLKNEIEVLPGIKLFNNKLSINILNSVDDDQEIDIKFAPYQTIVSKVTSIDEATKEISLTSAFSSVFNSNPKYSINLLETYMDDFNRVSERLSQKNEDLGNLRIGEHVSCVVNKYDPNRGCSVFIQPGNAHGIVELHRCPKKVTPGSTFEGVVLDINFKLKFALVTLEEKFVQKINKNQDAALCEDSLLTLTCYANLLMVNKDFALGVLVNKEANGQLVYLPVKLHENDFFPSTEYYDDLFKKKIKVVQCSKINGRIFGIEKGYKKMLANKKVTARLQNVDRKPKLQKKRKLANENSLKVKKVKLEETESFETNSVKSESLSENEDEEMEVDKVLSDNEESGDDEHESASIEDEENGSVDDSEEEDKDDSEEEDKPEDEGIQCEDDSDSDDEVESEKVKGPILPGIQNFFEAETDDIEQESSSSDEDDGESKVKQKKKKLSAAEKVELAKAEEQRLLKIETELADSSALPQSAEQFDRALLGNPDSSEMWLRYIAFHVQATEFEKARTIAKRALEKISYTATQERLNVWITYLNLENMYGTKDSFDTAFEEACRCNDSLTIYLASIQMLSEMQKFTEMDEKIKKVRAKFKQEVKMWLEVGKVYYQCKRYADARKLKDVALLSIFDKKTHVNLLVQFAVLEFNYGESNHGEALFETILQSDPKRVDVWCTYIDQLVKLNKTELARNVLKRAVGQKLAYKKMRTLFKKYHSFEKTYGDEESLMHVKKLLQEYGDD